MAFLADVTISSIANDEFDLIALPGGMPGATHLAQSETLSLMLKRQK